jgi:hypothetical protein
MSAGLSQTRHLGDDRGGRGEIDEQRACVDEIERGGGEPGLTSGSLHDLNLCEPTVTRECPREGNVIRIAVESNHAAARPDSLG